MLSYIKGSLEEIHDNEIVVDNNGIGYLINTSFETVSSLPGVGEAVKIFTILIPRDDAINLYGFSSKAELQMFELLLSVNGIGPKAALAILSIMTVDDIKFAVIGGDHQAFAKAPGVGKKTAERAIIDLKDKVELVDAFESKLSKTNKKKENGIVEIKKEVLDALVALGYSSSVAAKALDKMPISENSDVEQLLSDTLKQMSFL